MRVKLYIGLVLAVLVMINGCSAQKEGAKFSKPVMMSGNAMVVFFRQDDSQKTVASVWVDDRIVGTLLPEHYAQSFICPGKRSVRIEAHNGGNNAVVSKVFNAKKGEVLYLQVSDASSSGQFEVHQVEPTSAEAALQNLAAKSHVINRHLSCKQNYIELDADTLFVFGESSLAPAGQAMLDGLANNLKENVTIKKLRITGYTDRLGNDAHNDKLSLARAKAVAAYLNTKGIKVPIETIGMGERYPISKGCAGDKPTPKLMKCLAPDRRVKIEIIGLTTQTAN